jgi:hypothetical protein
MPSEAQDRWYWLILVGAFTGAAGFFAFAVVVLVHVFTGHGSHAGNILRVGLGIGAFFLGLFLCAVGALYRLSFDEEHSKEFH